ncbi:unnamed protein product, partial [Rotaria sp. Silwood1]
IQSILSSGKYRTSAISSNITYVSHVYTHNFLAYSPHDDLLIFIEPKHHLYVYDAQTIRLIVNLTTTDVIYATSSTSFSVSDRRDLFFIYESRLESGLLSLRVCEVIFNKFKLSFEDKNCIKTLLIHSNKNDMHVNGLTIKRNHAKTEKSILFISTDIGLIYSIFNTYTGILIHEPVILNGTLNEGNIVITPSGIVYYANKQEHTIHELRITQDFRVRYGKIIKSSAIKAPFGLIADECNHLFIATKLMILIMYVEKYTTIRSVLPKTSDLPITIERLNSTTYVYVTVKENSGKIPTTWTFNFLSFIDPEKPVVYTRRPETFSDDDTTSISNTDVSTNTLDEYSQLSTFDSLFSSITQLSTSHEDKDHDKQITQENLEMNEDKLPFSSSSISNEDYIEYLHSPMSTSTSLETTSMTNPFDMTRSMFLSDEKPSNADLSIDKIYDHTDRLVENAFNTKHVSPTISSHEPLTTKKESFVTEFNLVHQSDQSFSSFDNIEPTQLPSTVIHENTTLSMSKYFSNINVSHSSSDFELLATPSDPSVLEINDNQIHSSSLKTSDVMIPNILLDTTLLQNQSYSTTTMSFNYNLHDDLNDEFQVITNQSIKNIQNETLFMTVTNFIHTEMENENNQTNSSSISTDVNISTTLHSSSPFVVSSTVPILTINSQLSSPLHPSLSHSSTTLTKINRLSSSKYFSATTTTISAPPTMLPPSSINLLQTTDLSTSSDITEKNSISIFFDESFSSSYTSTTSSLSSTATNDQFISKFSNIFYDESLTSTISLESSTTDYTILSTIVTTSTNLDLTTTVQTNEYSSLRLETTNDEQNLVITNEDSEIHTSFQSSSEITSTIFLDVHNSETEHSTLVVTYPSTRSRRPTRRRTSKLSTISTTTSTKSTDVYRTRRRKITHWKSRISTVNTSTSLVRTSTINHQFLTSTPFSIDRSNSTSLQQQMIVIKPSININSSNTLLSNELFNKLFNSTTNSSTEKIIYFNLLDIPPSSWNLALNTNESIVFDIAVPSSSYSSNFHRTTNLTITNVEANRLSTNIIGSPVNLQVDKVQAKKFSLAMNQGNNETNQSLSDVIIGYIKTEQFELKLTKLDNMNMHIQQIDSETAEIYFDSQFCTDENNLEINLKLSKAGTVRYGNRTPSHIGPVFTRLHMLRQSCDLDQPLRFFFDICQSENPCLNGGTCESLLPDYDNKFSSLKKTTEVHYQCICPLYITGEHCQYLRYPFGYCVNGGNLVEIVDLNINSKQKCLCPQGFQGDHCEDNIDDCINIKCSNHGICLDDINSYRCSCFDGYYGNECEERRVEMLLIQVASKSFASVAILLIISIGCLVIASDIHTYLTRKQTKRYRSNKIPRVASELFENSVLLLGFSDAPMEMSDLSAINIKRQSKKIKQYSMNIGKKSGYRSITRGKYIKTLRKPTSKSYILSNPTYQKI